MEGKRSKGGQNRSYQIDDRPPPPKAMAPTTERIEAELNDGIQRIDIQPDGTIVQLDVPICVRCGRPWPGAPPPRERAAPTCRHDRVVRHDEDDDLRYLVGNCDIHIGGFNIPDSDTFWQTVVRRHPLLVRAAYILGQPVPPLPLSGPPEPMTPKAIRVCASWILGN